MPILTIKDLSAQTGYSVGTISRVLNNQPNVSQKARETILRAASACGFQLNANAKQLKQQHSNSILVLVKGTHNELFGSLVECIQAQIAETKYSLIVDYMIPIYVNGVDGMLQVNPGDYVFGDMDGVVIVPKELTVKVLEVAEKAFEAEKQSREAMAKGEDPFDVYNTYGRF